MSRIRELRLHGFKTFADPTRFVFGRGVTAVIGPNGSGKSNMADAVRWVLGEQSNRSLRTRRADDVIFAGSDGRRAQGMAEVVLTLDNSDRWLPVDYLEVTVGRRAYRSGESEYLLNGTPTRRREIVELLAAGRLGANELVVVGQGTVDAALSLRPEERRQLFEEAAGVKGLQVRKNEALARLGSARDNLARVADLIDELKPQVRRLAAQAQHQQQHDTLGARAAALASESFHRREASLRAVAHGARRRADAAAVTLAGVVGEEERNHASVAEAESQYRAAESAANRLATRHGEVRETLIRSQTRAEALRVRLLELRGGVADAREELGAAEEALALERSDLGEAGLPQLAAEAALAETHWKGATTALAAADASMLAAENSLAELRHRHSRRIAGAARSHELQARQQARLEHIEDQLRAANATMSAAAAELEPASQAVAAATAELIAVERSRTEAAGAAEIARAAAEASRNLAADLAARIGTLESEITALHEQAEQGGGRLASQLATAGWEPVLDSFNLAADAWPAIEALIGGGVETALLWRDGDLAARLGDARGGARLLTTGGRPAGEDLDERSRALAAVSATLTIGEWIGAPDGPHLFARAVLAPDTAALLDGWQRLPPGWCAVTREGDFADSRGLIVVQGRREAKGSQAARRHARRVQLSEAVAATELEHQRATGAAAVAVATLAKARHTETELEQRALEVRQRAGALQSAADAISASLARLQREVRDLSDERARTAAGERAAGVPTGDQGGDDGQLALLEGVAEAARNERDLRSAAREQARAAWRDARTAADGVELDTAHRRDRRAGLEATATHLRALLPRQLEALAKAEEDLAVVEIEAQAALVADERSGADRAAADAERDRLRAVLLESERAKGAGGSRRAELERETQAAAIELARAEDGLTALAREREFSIEQAMVPSLAEVTLSPFADELASLDGPGLEAELRRARRTLAELGSVNPFAVEEHRELAARLDGLVVQRADLDSASSAAMELIGRMDAEIKQTFDAAFTAIGARFNDFCRLLFAGGTASLERIDDAETGAGGGIEIVVQPPGKRLQRLAMLSGGERALTGVALLFAMLSVHPVPFCILDEVDAALDEANIGRFADALRTLARDTDFVVVTHNRATIEVADTIYGVTMTDAAVSRILSLQLADLPTEALIG